MVDRPDWNVGGPVAVVSNTSPPVPAALAFDGKAFLAEVEARNNNRQAPAVANNTGMPAETIQSMQRTADGFDATLATMQATATAILADVQNRDGAIAAFDALSPSLQANFYAAMMSNPGTSLAALLDKLEPRLTLAEQHEAETALRDAKRAGVL